MPFYTKRLEQEPLLEKTFRTRKKIIKTTTEDLLRHSLLDFILRSLYFYELISFDLAEDCRHKNHFIKMIFEIMDYKFDNVSNDIMSKQTNGLKATTTTNTQILEIFIKVFKARPLTIYGLKSRKVRGFLPKRKEFFNLTGNSVGFKTFFFYNNKDYRSTHALKPFGEVRKKVSYRLRAELQKYKAKAIKKPFIRKRRWKRKLKFNFKGYRVRLKNKYRRYRFKFKTVILTGKKNRTFVKKRRNLRIKKTTKFH